MADALGQVKRCFGREAVILTTRTITRGRFLGMSKRSYVEITAAASLADLPEPLRRQTATARSAGDGHMDRAGDPLEPRASTLYTKCQGPARGLGARVTGLPPGAPTRQGDALLAELGSLKRLDGDLVRETRRTKAADVPENLYDTYSSLVQNEVADALARGLVDRLRNELSPEQLRDAARVKVRLANYLEAMLPTSGPVQVRQTGQPTVVALVGPTGVGKTTTVAKLAANFQLREGRRVGLITIDTYRIAAVEQLKTYAEIIGVPLEVVMTPDSLREAVARMADRDLILIDTAGRGQRDVIKIKELQRFFAAVHPHEIHLVLASTSGAAVMAEILRQFQEIGIDRVILTKLDEAVGFGVILNCLEKTEARLSYVTTGQDVPDDIAVAESRTLAGLVLGKGVERPLGIATNGPTI